jgi:hypothetical protein
LDSLREEPIRNKDKTIAPIASQIPDQYKPDATGDALRNPIKRESEFRKITPSRNIRLYQLMATPACIVQAFDYHIFRAILGNERKVTR